MVQWLRLLPPNAEGPGSILDQGTGSHVMKLKDPACWKEYLKKELHCQQSLDSDTSLRGSLALCMPLGILKRIYFVNCGMYWVLSFSFLFIFFLDRHITKRGSLVAQMGKNLLAMWEAWVQSLGWEEPPEESIATHSSVLAWRIPWTGSLAGYSPSGHKELDTTKWQITAHIMISNSGKTVSSKFNGILPFLSH